MRHIYRADKLKRLLCLGLRLEGHDEHIETKESYLVRILEFDDDDHPMGPRRVVHAFTRIEEARQQYDAYMRGKDA
jgi:hypothetical protein